MEDWKEMELRNNQVPALTSFQSSKINVYPVRKTITIADQTGKVGISKKSMQILAFM